MTYIKGVNVVIGVPKETYAGEHRVALIPSMAERLIKKNIGVTAETGLGESIHFKDSDYEKVGVKMTDRMALLSNADMIVRVRKPPIEEISHMKAHAIHISFLDPFHESALLSVLSNKNISAISMEMIPRTTVAQKMDALSSQANLAGYVAVIMAAGRIDKIFPMLITPAGTIAPIKVFVIGAGVAGLQAIATAKRLGARVDAFDTRPVVEEQVKSLGAKFVKIDLGETGQTKDGYAKALTRGQIETQRQAIKKVCAQSDIIITTAQLFGRKAPLIITRDIIEQMAPGSVIVDMAVESGGNVEGSQLDQETVINGVRIIGFSNLPSHVSLTASHMYSSNIVSFIEHFWDPEKKNFPLDMNNEIMRACLITHQGGVVNTQIKEKTGDT